MSTAKASEICANCGERSDAAAVWVDAQGFVRTECTTCVQASE